MATTKAEAIIMDRRKLLKLTGTYGIGASFISPAALFAAGECDKIVIDNSKVTASADAFKLYYWIDGMHLASFSPTMPSRANLTVFMDLKQTDTAFVESVVLTDDKQSTLGARYFDASQKMKTGHVPYVTFEGMALDPTKEYTVYYNMRMGTTSKIFYAKIAKPLVSRLNTTWLPLQLVADMKNFLVGGANITPGLITTPFQFYTQNGLSAHSARGRITDIQSDGKFKVNIDFMHGDASPTHYMRYFMVLDPVGRILGYYKRTFGEGGGPTLDVVNLTALQIKDNNIPAVNIADIRDCPWVQIYTEDSFDAIARSVIRMR